MADLRIGTATSAPAAGTLKLGSTDISKIYSGSTLVWPIANEDPYVPVEGNPRFITSITTTPYFSLVDENLNTVTPPVTFGNLPNSNYTIKEASDNLNIMIATNASANASLISYDKGQSWGAIPNVPSKRWQYVNISSNGEVIVLNTSGGTTAGDIYVSTDSGVSFSLSSVNIATLRDAGITVSSGGKYIYITGGTVAGSANNTVLYRSNDYGQTFTDITNLLSNAGYPSSPSQRPYITVSVSGNGERVFIVGQSTTGDFYSSDFGSTFSSRTFTNAAHTTFKQSETGQYIVSGSQTALGGDWYSKDFGVNKLIVAASSGFIFNSISNSGKYSFWSGSSNGSTNIPVFINTDFFATQPSLTSWPSGLRAVTCVANLSPSADPYVPIVGSSFRALGSLASSPFIGLFDSSLALVSPQPSFGALPNVILIF
jgi:hypothetical protein